MAARSAGVNSAVPCPVRQATWASVAPNRRASPVWEPSQYLDALRLDTRTAIISFTRVETSPSARTARKWSKKVRSRAGACARVRNMLGTAPRSAMNESNIGLREASAPAGSTAGSLLMRASIRACYRPRVALRALLLVLASGAAIADTVTVRDADALRRAVREAKPGRTVLVAPGEYAGGLWFENVNGEAGKPVVVAGADPKNPPVFRGGGEAMHFAGARHLELRDLAVEGSTANGISVDDAGRRDGSTHHVTIRNVRFTGIGARGNEDALKLSGVDDFRVEACAFERWGAGGGSAIDMVGCHKGTIESCTFRHPEAANAVQTKGGSASVTVRKCRFDDAGSRAVNIGGSTGLEFFRPPLDKPPFAEARDIVVEGCTFAGSDAPVAFVGVDGAVVRFNTFYAPRRWAMRILQETTADGFVPCRNGEFSRNVVVFRSDRWSEGGVNVGGGTDAATFRFEGNVWFCADAPARSKPRLPSAEKDGVYGTDPKLADPEKGDLSLGKGSPVRGAGAEALQQAGLPEK